MRTFILLLVGSLVACGSPAYRAAAEKGTAQAYERFARNNPADPKAGSAMNRAEGLRWQAAQQEQSAAAWSAYLRSHSDAPRAEEARGALDEAVFQEALQDKDALALERYITSFPDGAHRKEARGHLDAVHWHDATSDDTHVSYRRYMLQEPDGEHAKEAEQRYEERVWDRASRVDTLRSYRLYLDELPDGPHGDDARARIGELQFTKVRVVVALGESWQTDRAAALRMLHKHTDTFTPQLKGIGFQVMGVRTADIGPGGDVATLVGREPGVGTIVVAVDDAKGEPFQPRGFETHITGTVQVFSPAREGAMTRWEIVGATGEDVYARDESGLYQSAAEFAMGDAWSQLGRAREFHPNPK